jgi:hypothetical protein
MQSPEVTVRAVPAGCALGVREIAAIQVVDQEEQAGKSSPRVIDKHQNFRRLMEGSMFSQLMMGESEEEEDGAARRRILSGPLDQTGGEVRHRLGRAVAEEGVETDPETRIVDRSERCRTSLLRPRSLP